MPSRSGGYFSTKVDEIAALARNLSHSVHVLWFYFGYSAAFTLVGDNRWSCERAEKWLVPRPAVLCCVENEASQIRANGYGTPPVARPRPAVPSIASRE